MKTYLVSFTSTHPEDENQKVNNLVAVHAENFDQAVEKVMARRQEMGMPLKEDDQFINATIE